MSNSELAVRLRTVVVLCLMSCTSGGEAQGCRPSARTQLPTSALVINGHPACVEVATTEQARIRGLMFRQWLAPDSGMLFVFDGQQQRRFWMHNTFLPLSIAFIDSSGIITDLLEMTPLDTTERYVSSRPARYALEMNSGWFETRGITAGDTVRGLPR